MTITAISDRDFSATGTFIDLSLSNERFSQKQNKDTFTLSLRDQQIPSDLKQKLVREYCQNINTIFKYTGNIEEQTQIALLSQPEDKNLIEPYLPKNFDIKLVFKNGNVVAGYSTFIFKLETGEICSGALYLFTTSEARGSGIGTDLYRETIQDLHQKYGTKYHFGEVTDPNHVYTESDKIQAKKTLEYWKNRGRMQISAPWFENILCQDDEVIAFNKDLLTVTEMPNFRTPAREFFTKEEFLGIWKAFNDPSFLHFGADYQLAYAETVKELEMTKKDRFFIEILGTPR